MAALGWLLNLGFAGSGAITTDVAEGLWIHAPFQTDGARVTGAMFAALSLPAAAVYDALSLPNAPFSTDAKVVTGEMFDGVSITADDMDEKEDY